jgi:SnoaL-like domain
MRPGVVRDQCAEYSTPLAMGLCYNPLMTREDLHRWLQAYGRAWEGLNPGAAAELFSEDATYQETPFIDPARGRVAILEYWKNVARTQEHVHFDFEILSLDGAIGFAHWASTFVRLPMKLHVQLDGILLLTFDAENHCTSLREWWHRREIALRSS